ncbi:hypothetical protein L1887_19049 [Cichorium endivia]|nr:hypothetical protein L1887_19049 [Cichorium endivia]
MRIRNGTIDDGNDVALVLAIGNNFKVLNEVLSDDDVVPEQRKFAPRILTHKGKGKGEGSGVKKKKEGVALGEGLVLKRKKGKVLHEVLVKKSQVPKPDPELDELLDDIAYFIPKAKPVCFNKALPEVTNDLEESGDDAYPPLSPLMSHNSSGYSTGESNGDTTDDYTKRYNKIETDDVDEIYEEIQEDAWYDNQVDPVEDDVVEDDAVEDCAVEDDVVEGGAVEGDVVEAGKLESM